jgi:predicted RND superfamily exporter protein
MVTFVVRTRGISLRTVAVALIIAGIAGYLGRGIRIDTSIKALLPASAPSVRALAAANDAQGTTDRFTVAFESSDPKAAARFGQDLARELRTWSDAQNVVATRDLTTIRDHALYFLEPSDLRQLRDELRATKQRSVIAVTRPGLSNEAIPSDAVKVGEDWDDLDAPAAKNAPPPSTDTKTETPRDLDAWLVEKKSTFADDPRFSASELDALWPTRDAQGKIAWPEKIEVPLQNKSGTVQVVQARLSRPATDIRYTREVAQRFDDLVAKLRPETYAPDLRAAIVGSYEISGDVDTIMTDLSRATWLSGILVTLVLLAGFRSVRSIVVILIPVAVAMALSLALARYTFGELNILTAFLFAVLFGMGVDFAIHLLAHRVSGPQRTWPVIVREQWPALLSSAVTTAFCLITLMLAEFKAFREFGVLAAIGIVASLVSAVVLVPCLDNLFGPWRKPDQSKHLPPTVETPAAPIPAKFGAISRILRTSLIATSVLICAFGAPTLAFENDTGAMRASASPTTKVKRIAYGQALGKNSTGVPAVLVATDGAALDEAVQRLNQSKDQYPWIKSVVSAQTIIPALQDEKSRIVIEIAELSGELLDLSAHADDAESAKNRESLRALARLSQAQPLRQDEVPPWALLPFTDRHGHFDRLAHAHLRFAQRDLSAVREVVQTFRRLLDGLPVQAAASSFVFSDLADLLEADGAKLPLFCLLTIFVVMWFDLRSARAAAICFASLALGLGLAIGLLGLCGVHINFFNLAIIPAVIGTGIDTSIHLWHARAHHGVSSAGTNRGALLSGFTTIAAYSGLLIAQSPGLRSMGIVGITTICAAIFAAFVVLWLGYVRRP